MGAYLSAPCTDKDSDEATDALAGMSFGSSSMQGWRKAQEDAHITSLHLDAARGGQCGLFAVFDGHGGKEVSAFCEAHFADSLLHNSAYGTDDFSTALVQTFHGMDTLLRSDSAQVTKPDACVSQMLPCNAQVLLLFPKLTHRFIAARVRRRSSRHIARKRIRRTWPRRRRRRRRAAATAVTALTVKARDRLWREADRVLAARVAEMTTVSLRKRRSDCCSS